MSEYIPLLARAVADLDQNTGAARRALYERTRTELVAELRNLNPPLAEAAITGECLALEEAIRKVEADALHQLRSAAIPLTRVKIPDPVREEKSGLCDAAVLPQRSAQLDRPDWGKDSETASGHTSVQASTGAQPAAGDVLEELRSLLAEPGDAGSEGDPVLTGPRRATTRLIAEAFDSSPQWSDLAREPSSEPAAFRTELELLGAFDPEEAWTPPGAIPSPDEAAGRSERQGSPPPAFREPHAQEEPLPKRRALLKKAAVAVLSGLCAVMAGVTYSKRDTVRALLAREQPQVQQEVEQPRSKIAERVTQAQQPETSQSASAPTGQQAVLYEEDPADAEGKRYVGSVIWRTETVTSGPEQTAELAVKAEVEIPERRISMTVTFRANTIKAVPATHIIEITFNAPEDLPFGGVSNVPGIVMKQTEQAGGSPLAGLALKGSSGLFLVHLSSNDSESQRNRELLRHRSWFDIPIVYNNGQRAILAVEKGVMGERTFQEALAAWGDERYAFAGPPTVESSGSASVGVCGSFGMIAWAVACNPTSLQRD